MIAALLVLSLAQQSEDILVLTNARFITVSGAEGAGPVVIAGGKIRKIGGDVPSNARIVDLGGKIVIPGLIDAGCALGVAGPANEEGAEVAPQVRIVDSLDPRSPDLSRARQSGVTAAFVEPGNRGVIGGVGSVVKTAGASRSAMIVRESAALKAAMGPAPSQGNYSPRGGVATFYARRPTTRMGVAWVFRKAFADAGRGKDAGSDVLRSALDGKLPVRISASRVTDLETAIQLADEFGLSISFEEAQEAYKRADLLAKRKIPVLLRPSTIGGGPAVLGEPGEIRLDAFTLLMKAGVKTALLSADTKSEGLLGSIPFAVRAGAAPSDALRSVTLTPAEILGVADRLGSLDEGKDADLVVLSGEPHLVTTRVEKVLISGRWVFGERAER